MIEMEFYGSPDRPALQKVRRRPLYKQVIEAIADYIISNNVNVGDTLPTEMGFTQMLGLGRNTVREALRTGTRKRCAARWSAIRIPQKAEIKNCFPVCNLKLNRATKPHTIQKAWGRSRREPSL